MNITIKQHEGQIYDGEKHITVKHPQDMVFRDGVCFAYIAHRDNAKLCPIVRVDDDEVQPILRAVAELRKGKFSPPAGMAEPPMDPDKIEAELAKAAAAENDEFDDEDDDE